MRIRNSGWLVTVIAVTTLAFTTMPGPAFAAPAQSAPAFQLSPAQQARAKAKQEKFSQDMQAIDANKSLNQAQKTAKEKALSKAHDADMLTILTPQQRSEVTKERSQQAAFLKAHGAEIAQGKALADKLNKSITPAQKAKIKAAEEQFAKTANPRAQKIQADTSLSPQAKQQQLMKLSQELDPQIEAIMTPTQRAEYQKMQKLQAKLAAESRAAQAK